MRGFRENAVEWGNLAEQSRPKSWIMFVAEEVGLWIDRKPGGAAEFVFELAGAPTGVADEGAHDATRAACVGGGICGRDAHRPAEA